MVKGDAESWYDRVGRAPSRMSNQYRVDVLPVGSRVLAVASQRAQGYHRAWL
jgi:hypothetical protein